MDTDEQLYQRRQGYWLRVARERAGKSQQGAAEYIGLSSSSKSSISDYERGETPVPMLALRRLAKWYGVPLRLFTEPDLTAEEQLEERLARWAREAIHEALEEDDDPSSGHEPDEPPLARSA